MTHKQESAEEVRKPCQPRKVQEFCQGDIWGGAVPLSN